MASDELGAWDAVETAARIRGGDVTAREVIEAAVARAEAARPLGALFTETFERALDEANAAQGPLAGVPSAIKDLTRVAGVRTTWGSRTALAHVPRRGDPTARVAAGIGLVSLGKSATPEFGLTVTTEPLGFPACKNPWDPARSTGGSSGGAAALVAAGVVPMALASDGGGSIRIPAAATGLVGLKPSRGRLGVEGSNLLPVDVAVHGVVTRTVRDTIAFWSAVEKVVRPAIAPIGEVSLAPARPLRIAAFEDAPREHPVDDEVRRAVRQTASLCRSLGHSVDEIPFPFSGDVLEDFLQYWSLVAWFHDRLGRLVVHPRFDRTALDPWTRGLARWCASAPRAVWSAVRRLRAFGPTYVAAFAHHDVLLGPTACQPAPPLGYVSPDLPFELAKERILDLCPFTPIQNVAGAPAIALPLGRTEAGLPIGVQLAGRPGDDRMLLELAQQIESAQPWPRVAPPRCWRADRPD